ncbi:MAG: ABC transporter ATP-binding protein [Gammaproteobacteria bacterium]|nr:ABC transporter ATP-binding protein [Gammaproteobacteria bacterium]
MQNEPLLTLQSVSKIYPMGEGKLYALNNIDLTINKGEFLIILGPSGSGKTTLLNILGGMDQPTEGRVLFAEQDLAKASNRALTLYRRNQIGFVFQFYNLLPTLTALENVAVATEIAEQPMSALKALELVELKEYKDHFPAQMSGGQQQRVAIARALASNPEILLCDEPTGALDSKTGGSVLDLLQNICRDLHKNVVLITHNEKIAELGDRVITLRDGRIEKLT